jgi:polysaccharide deacetylase family protein (PEP-CTERM system associated)
MPKHYIVSRGTFNRALGVYRPIMDNMLTFEIEDRFHVENPDMESSEVRSRIIPLLIHLLDLLDNQKAHATFFILGWVARKFPEVVALIDSRGNEIASHGLTHGDVRKMPPEQFKSELERSRTMLEEIIQKPVYGYKAASPYLCRDQLSHYHLIAEAGYRYDASLLADGPRLESLKPFPIAVNDGRSIIAIPHSTRRKWGVAFRFGENLRILPGWFGINSIKSLNKKGYPAMVNMKLWEFDVHQPRSAGMDYFRFSQYGNLSLAEEKLTRLLDTFKFSSCAEVLRLTGKNGISGEDADTI